MRSRKTVSRSQSCRPASGSVSPIRRKHNLTAENDPKEAEAEKTSDSIMRMPENYFVQRKCEDCEKDELQRKEDNASGEGKTNNGTINETVSNAIDDSRGKGSAMDDKTKEFMQDRFGENFSDVNIHAGQRAGELATNLNAKAFTVGNDIYFNDSQYSPNTQEGKRLLAHELTHVIQQGGGQTKVARDAVKKTDGELLSEAIAKNDPKGWGTAYEVLNKQWMAVMLTLADTLSLTDIDNLITHETDAKKNSMVGTGGADRILAALYAVKSTKKKDMPASEIATAVQKALTIKIDQRIEIIDFLNKSKSKSAISLREMLNKPLLGYTASGYDFSHRFLKQSGKLGFDIAPGTASLPENKWKGTDPDPQDASITDAAIKAFDQSDLLFFSGHQYAQYKRPGLFTNDSSESCFNISLVSKAINRVKVVASTSCATICKDPAKIFSAKFPNAIILGYRLSAPLDGSKVSTAFSNELVSKGPLDLSSSADLQKIKDAWKKVVLTKGSKEGQPGILSGADVEFWNGKEWKTVTASSKENDCHYH